MIVISNPLIHYNHTVAIYSPDHMHRYPNTFLWQFKLPGESFSQTIIRYSRQIRSAVSIAPAAAAKQHISLCGCVHHFILVVSLFDRQYISILYHKTNLHHFCIIFPGSQK